MDNDPRASVDVYNVVDKDGNIVDQLRYPKGGSLYEGAKSNRDAGITNTVYRSNSPDKEQYEPLFSEEDVRAASSISLDKNTGKITVTAPSMALKNEAFKKTYDEALNIISQNYKLNPDYAYKLMADSDEEKTSEEWINDFNSDFGDVVAGAVAREGEKRKVKEKDGVDLSDEDVTKMYSIALEYRDLDGKTVQVKDETVQSLPERIKNLNAFSDLEGWDEDSHGVTWGNLKKVWDREKTKDEDIHEVFDAVDDYFAQGDFSNPSEYAEMVAFREFINGKDPSTAFLRGVVETTGEVLYGAIVGLADPSLDILSDIEAISNVKFNGKSVVKDIIEPAYEELKDERVRLLRQVNDKEAAAFATTAELVGLSEDIALSVLVGNLLAARVAKLPSKVIKIFEKYGATANELSKVRVATLLASEGADFTAAAKSIYVGTDIALNFMKASKAAETMAAAISRVIKLKAGATAIGAAVRIADVLAQAAVDVALSDRRMFRTLMTSDDTEAKAWALRQLALNAAGEVTGVGAARFLKDFGSSDVGLVLQTKTVPYISRMKANVGQLADDLKTAIHGGNPDWLLDTTNKLRDAADAKTGRWYSKYVYNAAGSAERRLRNLAERRILRQANYNIGELAGTVKGRTWEETLEAARRVKGKMVDELAEAQNLINTMYRGDVTALVYRFLRDDERLAGAETAYLRALDRVVKAEKAAGLGSSVRPISIGEGESKLVYNVISDETNAYVLGQYRIKRAEATIALSRNPDDVAGAKKELEHWSEIVNKFREEKPQELINAADELLGRAKQFSAKTQDLRVRMGVLSEKRLNDLRTSGFFDDGYVRLQRAKTWGQYRKEGGKLRLTELRDEQEFGWGDTDPFQDISIVLFDDLNDVARQVYRKKMVDSLRGIGVKVDTVVDGDTSRIVGEVNRVKKLAMKDLEHNTTSAVKATKSAIYDNFFEKKKGQFFIDTATKDVVSSKVGTTKARTKALKVTRNDRHELFTELLPDSDIDSLILSDPRSAFNIAVTDEESFQRFYKELDAKTKRWLDDRFKRETGRLYGVPVKPRKVKVAGAKEIDGHSYIGDGGYQKFISDNLSSNLGNSAKDKMSAIAVEQSIVTPGGDTDNINPLLRSGELVLGGDGATTSTELKEKIDNIDVYALAANYYRNADYFGGAVFGESGVEQNIVDLARELLGKKPLKNAYEISSEDIAAAEKIIRDALEDGFIGALKKGNYTLKNDAILYRVVSDEGNAVNQGGDLSWLNKQSGEYSDKGFTSVTLNEDAVLSSPVLSGAGKKYILRYHIPSGENIYAFDGRVWTGEDTPLGDFRRVSSGHRAGGEFMLTPDNSGTFVKSGEFKDGAEYVDVYMGGAPKLKVSDEDIEAISLALGKEAKIRARDVASYENLSKIIDDDPSFISQLKRVYAEKNFGDMLDDQILDAKRFKAVFDADTLYKDNLARLKEMRRKYDLPELNANVDRQVDEFIDDVVSANTDNPEVKQAITALADDLTSGDDLLEYSSLQSMYRHRKHIKNQFYDRANKTFNEALTKNMRDKYGADKKALSRKKQQVNKMANEWANETTEMLMTRIEERYGAAVNKLMQQNSPLVDEKTRKEVFKHISELNKEITEAIKTPNVIKSYDAFGQEEYIELSPTIADMFTSMPRPIRRGPFGELQAAFVRLFRFGTTGGLVPGSLVSQGFRDTGNAVVGGDAMKGAERVKDELARLFGDRFAEEYQKNIPDVWQTLLKKSEETGEDVNRLIAERELRLGAENVSRQQEANIYQLGREAKVWRNERGIYEESWMERARDWIDEKQKSLEKLNTIREVALRKRVYNNNLLKGMKQGLSVQQARNLAEFMQAEATTNFVRQSYHLANLSKTVPYLSAAINGQKSFWRLMSWDPIGVTTRIIGGYVVPVIALTNMSLSTEENKRIYKQIPEYEKADNLVFVLDGQILSIPIPQEISSFVTPVQHMIETMQGENDSGFAELMANDLLGMSPVDLSGFMNLDADKLVGDNVFENHLVPGFMKAASTLMPPLVKTGFILATGVDPYTTKRVSRNNVTTDPETGEQVLMDYTAGSAAMAIGGAFGSYMSPGMAEKVLTNLIGQGNTLLLNGIFSLASSVVDPDKNFLTDGAGKVIEDYVTNATKRLTVERYREESNAAWNRAVARLWEEKNSLLADKSYQADLSALAKSDLSDEARKTITSRINSRRQEFMQKVLDTANRLVSEYDGTFDRNKFASVVSLMNLDSDSENQLPQNEWATYLSSQERQTNRAAAIETMANMGFSGPDDGSIFGYYSEGSDGRVTIRYSSPLSILNFQRTERQQDAIAFASIYKIINDTSLHGGGTLYDEMQAYDKQIQAIYDKKKKTKQDYANIEQLQINWNSHVAALVAPVISQMTPEAAINNKRVRDLLYTYIYVPSSYATNNRGRYVSLGDDGSKKAAYYDSFIKRMFGINDPYKGQY